MIEPTSELNVYYKVYIILEIYPEDDPELSLPYEKTIRDAFSRVQEDEELPWVLKQVENVEEDEDFSLIFEEVEEPEKPPISVFDSHKSSPVTVNMDELTFEFEEYVKLEEPEEPPTSVFEGLEARPILIKIVPPDWETYMFVGILSQHQLDHLIEDEYRYSLTWWPTPTVIDDNPFPVVRWDGNYRDGNIRSLYARLIPSPADVVTNDFENADAFLSFIQKRYAATHNASCRCKGCQETKGLPKTKLSQG